MLGLYPENPGSDTLLLSTPGFAHAQIDAANGKTITVNAPDAKNEYYARSLTINGQPDQKLSTTFDDLSHGSTLDWTLSPTADQLGQRAAGRAAVLQRRHRGDRRLPDRPDHDRRARQLATIKVGADNATAAAQQVKVSITAPAGVTISPASATIDVPADGEATTTLTVTAGATTTQNYYSAPVTLTTESTGATQSLTQTILVAAPGSLLVTFNNEGIASDANPSLADFDGDGNSYSAQALAADGFTAGQDVTENGVTFTWPSRRPATRTTRSRTGNR